MAQTYTEDVFRYFLRVERNRGAKAHRSVLLLLVRIKQRTGAKAVIPRAVAEEIFSGLWLTVREVDFVGWFRQGRIVAAVLTQGDAPPAVEDCRRIAERITDALQQCVSSEVADHLDVKVRRLGPRQNGHTSERAQHP